MGHGTDNPANARQTPQRPQRTPQPLRAALDVNVQCMYCSIKLLRANSLRAVSGQLILIMALLAEAEHLLDIVAESGRGVSELALVRIDDGLVPDKVGLVRADEASAPEQLEAPEGQEADDEHLLDMY